MLHQVLAQVGAGDDPAQMLFAFLDQVQQVTDLCVGFEPRLDLGFQLCNLIAQLSFLVSHQCVVNVDEGSSARHGTGTAEKGTPSSNLAGRSAFATRPLRVAIVRRHRGVQ